MRATLLVRGGMAWRQFATRTAHVPVATRIASRSYSIRPGTDDPSAVRIIEVGPRDGLQNIKTQVSTSTKVELINRLASTGLRDIEATSFVSPKWVPQLADGAAVTEQVLHLAREQQIRLPVLAPNLKGLANAVRAGAREIVVFASCTEEFSKRNQNCTVEEALNAAEAVTSKALEQGIAVRGVVSCIFSDPYSGPTPPSNVRSAVRRLLDMGCYEVGLGDTLGVGTPRDTESLLAVLLKDVPASRLAGHFHDTYGQAVANVVKSYDMGLRTFDSSIAGLGGCPYAKGARGNASTEDIVYTLEKSGISTGIDLEKLAKVGEWISKQLGLPNSSRAGAAIAAKSAPEATVSSSAAANASKRDWQTVQDTGEYIVSRSRTAVKVTLNRPRNGNALTGSMVDGLTQFFRNLKDDMSIFHVVLTANGKFFCTGMDLSGGTETSNGTGESSYYSKVANLFEAIDNCPQTTIAALNGSCYGGGVGLQAVCDVRLVSAAVRWTLTEVKLGLQPAIISKYLVREWGISFFREAMLSGREISPAELQRVGAIHGIAEEATKLDQMVEEYLDKLALCAPRSASACKELVRLGWTNPGGQEQETYIQHLFNTMMIPGSEGKYGIEQFQKKVKRINWGSFWTSQTAKA